MIERIRVFPRFAGAVAVLTTLTSLAPSMPGTSAAQAALPFSRYGSRRAHQSNRYSQQSAPHSQKHVPRAPAALSRVDDTLIPVVASRPELPVEAAKPNMPAKPIVPAKPADPLVERVHKAITISKRRYLSADKHTPWQIAHGVVGLRQDLMLKKNGKKVPALEWIASGPSFQGDPWFKLTRHGGKAHPFTEPYAFEGHPNQFLALFTLAKLPTTFEIKVGRKTITVADMVNNAKMEVNNREEITWTLWALAYYLDPDSEWVNQHGEPWSIERLVRIQMSKPVTRAACGGLHGLFAIASARNAHLQSGESLRGTWLEAHMHVKKYVQLARAMQNRDGSFSSNHFKGRGHSTDVDRRLNTTGHALEFLMVALPQDELNQAWVRRAVDLIARDLINHSRKSLEPGGMYHAIDSLMIYLERVDPQPSTVTQPQVASDSSNSRLKSGNTQPSRTAGRDDVGRAVVR